MKPRVCGPTLLVPIGATGVMTVSTPGADPHLEWSLRYGSPEAVRFHAASVVESFDYLLSSNINMTEAMRRLRLLRAAVRGHVSGVGGAHARGWPADKDAEPVPMPKLPPAIVMHPQLGELFDRLAMHTYAMGYAMACADAGVKGGQGG